MVDALNVLFSGLLIYTLLMMFFIPLFKIGLFECYMFGTKNSSHEVLRFLEHAHLEAANDYIIRFFSLRSDRESEVYLEKCFESLSLIGGLFSIVIANFFLISCMYAFVAMSIQASQTKGVVGTIIALVWLAYSVWSYVNALRFVQLLRTENRRLKNSTEVFI